MKNLLIVLCSIFSAFPVLAVDPPPLEKSEATKILQLMEWKEVKVIVILQGVHSNGATAPIYATIVGLGTRDQRHQRISQTLYYDRDLGWCLYEVEDKRARIWSKDGFRDIRPWVTW